jgi:thymidylate kinase
MKNHHRSIVISFMGVDGSGKSTLIELLRKKLKNKFKKIKYVHLRPYLILLDKSTIQANPHKTKKTWPILLNFIRILYWLIIYRLFFYLFANKPRQLIIFDRYAHDLMIDSTRYKFNLPNRITKFILNFFPNPSLWIVLNAPIKVLEKRKKELPTKELKKQIRIYLNFAKQRKNSIVINTNNSVQSSLSLIIKKLITLTK